MQADNETALREELVQVRNEHRTLDEQIVELESAGAADQLQIKRLKKHKLALKDRITSIEDRLTPDIIA
ncbi:MAG: DUF465 domain-containing protein [Pseudomonadota bacterium]